MSDDLVTRLLPVLGRSLEAEFNVFDVMHHGTHEKQISNVFRWMLEVDGTHGFGDTFLRIFVDEVNRRRASEEPFGYGPFVVRQEVNVSEPGAVPDIADLVLDSPDSALVVENYFTSDGHGHNYGRYANYSQREGRRGVVVLLCFHEDDSLKSEGWENAVVLTYGTLIERLRAELDRLRGYSAGHPEPYSFIDQMHRKFVKGRGPVRDAELLNFVTAMCDSGQAGRYAERSYESAGVSFANDVAEQARDHFDDGRELLQRVKNRLTSFSRNSLVRQLNRTLGDGFVNSVGANFVGNYRWTVFFDIAEPLENYRGSWAALELKFGPSAWFANERDPSAQRRVSPELVDYSHLFVTRAKIGEIRQSAVSLQDVLTGLGPDDVRLHDEIVDLLRADP